jgi:folate-binding protein YgfZ
MAKSQALDERKQVGTIPAGPGDSSLEQEYSALTEGVGLLDQSHVGRLSISGEDALDLLNRLSTNELTTIEVGEMVPTVLTSNKGRILDLLFVLRLEDRLLVLTDPENRQKVIDWLDFYTIMEDASVEDTTEDTAMLSLVGPRAADLLDGLTGGKVGSLDLYRSTEATIGGVQARTIRADFVRLPGYDLVVAASEAEQLAGEIIDHGAAFGLASAGNEALEIVRVEQGVPSYGAELGEEFNPLEAGLKEFVSFTKGCYVGQEVVIRILHRGQGRVARRLVGLLLGAGDPAPDAGAALHAADRPDADPVGTVTTARRSPALDRPIALGYVKRELAAPGTELAAAHGDRRLSAVVTARPFLPLPAATSDG